TDRRSSGIPGVKARVRHHFPTSVLLVPDVLLAEQRRRGIPLQIATNDRVLVVDRRLVAVYRDAVDPIETDSVRVRERKQMRSSSGSVRSPIVASKRPIVSFVPSGCG